MCMLALAHEATHVQAQETPYRAQYSNTKRELDGDNQDEENKKEQEQEKE